MTREICIHGHFYQPPRENPWLEEIETQDSAYPFHDWNHRVTEECYAPNSASRILDAENRIVRILNNYSRISFNFGPTLLAWMEAERPRLYHRILEADRLSRERFSGHGAALAQAYNHIILPLADSRDKRTQILWGVRDFRSRFGREPEGMWLPETAVDLETLDLMAEYGIAFTILAPRQARLVRRIGESRWEDVSGGCVDPRRAYLCRLPSGRSISLFFYDGEIAHEVSFGGLLKRGDAFVERLASDRRPEKTESPLAHIATDGETFGHHHRFGDMALSYALHAIEERYDVRLTVYADYLERNPPRFEAAVVENSSWSCVHGVERWRNDCGCRTGGHPDWRQKWRGPLRAALDGLRGRLASDFESGLKGRVSDPWKLRDDYIDVILDRSPASVGAFFARHGLGRLSRPEKTAVLKMLEAQRCAQLMYTSCGWFFNDISGIETVQILSYAARAMQLARETGGSDYEPDFTERLREAPGNSPEYPDGAVVYERRVRPAVLDLFRVGVHAAIASLFPREEAGEEFPAFTIQREASELREHGRMRLALGKARIRRLFTGEERSIGYGALHLGGHNLMAGVRSDMAPADLERVRSELTAGFESEDVPAVINALDLYFGRPLYSLGHLFRDRKRRVMGELLASSLKDFENALRPAVEQHDSLLRAAREMAIPLPRTQSLIVEFSLTMRMRRLLEKEDLDLDDIERTGEEIRAWEFRVDRPALRRLFSEKLAERMTDLTDCPESLERLSSLRRLAGLLTGLDPEMNLWASQNLFDRMTRRHYQAFRDRAETGDVPAKEWIAEFRRLGGFLKVRAD